jgi:hypothetical protein
MIIKMLHNLKEISSVRLVVTPEFISTGGLKKVRESLLIKCPIA